MAIIGDGRKRNYGLLLLLVVLLAAAATLTWNVYNRQDGEPLIRPPSYTVTTRDTAIVPTVDELMADGRKWGPPPEWHGSAQYTKNTDGKFDITITPEAHGGGLVDLTSYQVFAQDAEGKNEQDITKLFTKVDGHLKGAVEAKGDMQLRIRLHRDLSTFEFTQKLLLK